MVSTSFPLASDAMETNQCGDTGTTKRPDDRRGTLTVKSGPPTRGRGRVADSVRPLQVDSFGPPVSRSRTVAVSPGTPPGGEGYALTIGQIRPMSRGIPPRTHLLSQAGS
jgi:hypothetical protein